MNFLCRVEEVPEGQGREFRLEWEGRPRYIAVFNRAAGFRAFVNACPHQGRSLNWAPDEFLFTDEGRLVCAHHGACFDLDTGACVSGPCPGASLTPVELVEKDGALYGQIPEL
ncbi:MAG: Rieske (2Fe-2S) protein [Xanthomonadales bacterium]|nr:Rieske (2Fe-2S) protein [Xanthomonadales bacterium]